ncbi:MAG: alpha/beta hydrolase [bacterium]
MRNSRCNTQHYLVCLFVIASMFNHGLVASQPALDPDHGNLVAVDGGNLWYEDAGEGFPLVLIHDGLCHSAVWENQFAVLAGTYRVIRYDRRGFGRSDQPEAVYSNLDDLHALICHLGLERVVLMGSSSGGGLALDYTLAHPERIEALVLAGPVVSGLPYSSHFNVRGYRNYDPDLETMIQHWVADEYTIAPGNDMARQELQALFAACPHNLDLTKFFLLDQSDPPALPRLHEIIVPVLLVSGEHDAPDVHAHLGAIESGILGARRIVIRDAGHLPYLEQPTAFNEAVLEFLSLISLPPDCAGAPAAGPGVDAVAPWNSFERGYAHLPSSVVYFEIMGQGEPLVLLHGGMVDHRMWDDQFAVLAEHFRVIRYDSGNHGLSHAVDPGFLAHEELEALLDYLGIEKAHLMGLSLGGRISIDFALVNPERVRSLVLAGSGLSGYESNHPTFQAVMGELRAAWMAGDWEGVVVSFMSAWTDGPDRTADQLDQEMRQKVWRMGISPIRLRFAGGEGGELDPPAIGRLSEVAAPTLFILGDEDMPSIHEISGLVAEQVPGARLEVFEGVAHQLNMELPERFNELVLEFLQQ